MCIRDSSYSVLTPVKGDYFVGILKKDNTLDLTWIFKATSGNYETLYLANDKDPENSEVKLFQNMKMCIRDSLWTIQKCKVKQRRIP